MRFYVLEHALGSDDTPFIVDYTKAEAQRADGPYCALCRRPIGPKLWLPPFKVELDARGTGFGDIAMPGLGDDILISERFRRLWEEQGLRGLNGFEPVEVVKIERRKAEGKVPKYFRAAVARSRAALNPVASSIVWNNVQDPNAICPECRWNTTASGIKAIRRVVIEPGTWSGEDLFIARGFANFIASNRFREFCDAHKINNAVLIPAEEYWFDFELQGSGVPWKAAMRR